MFQSWFLSIYIYCIFANASPLFAGPQCRTKVCAALRTHRKASNFPPSPAELSVPVCALIITPRSCDWQAGLMFGRKVIVKSGSLIYRVEILHVAVSHLVRSAHSLWDSWSSQKTGKKTKKTQKPTKNPLRNPPTKKPPRIHFMCNSRPIKQQYLPSDY